MLRNIYIIQRDLWLQKIRNSLFKLVETDERKGKTVWEFFENKSEYVFIVKMDFFSLIELKKMPLFFLVL